MDARQAVDSSSDSFGQEKKRVASEVKLQPPQMNQGPGWGSIGKMGALRVQWTGTGLCVCTCGALQQLVP